MCVLSAETRREGRSEKLDKIVAWRYVCCMENLRTKMRCHEISQLFLFFWACLGPRIKRGEKGFLGFLPLSPY